MNVSGDQDQPAIDEIERLRSAERLIVQRLKRYAARADGILKADKAICIVRERFSYIRSGRLPMHDAGRGERARLKDTTMTDNTTTAPWCVLCGQCHAFDRPCDPARLAWIAERCRELDAHPTLILRAIENLTRRGLIEELANG